LDIKSKNIIMNLGYACINMTMGKKVTTNRTMVKRTFESKGLDYVSELALLNAKDIIRILEWNRLNGINLFRLSSALIPWGDNIDITQLKDYKEIKSELKKAGDYAKFWNMRINSHPGPFNVLVSPNESVVLKTIADLELHGKVFDMMGLSKTPYNNINIHCNGVYGDKKSALDRFIKNFQRLSKSVQKRLTIENDDKASMYSVKDLMYVHNVIGIPIVFDYHHHQFCTGDLSEEQALKLAATTWPDGIKQEVHYSESKALHENNQKEKPQAHSYLINALPNTYGLDLDIMVEAKGKELAILPYLKYQTNENVRTIHREMAELA
jgi:UV DNA damage endonuclease